MSVFNSSRNVIHQLTNGYQIIIFFLQIDISRQPTGQPDKYPQRYQTLASNILLICITVSGFVKK